MNRVYKVIWNKGKNCYSVVSEIAKNHGKSSSCRKKAVTAVMTLSLLSAGGLAYAQDPATPAPEPDNGIHYFSVNANDSAKPEKTNWNSDGAKGVAAIAVGPSAGAQGDYGTAVGPWAKADGKQASAFGVAANASGANATAAGTYAVAGNIYAAAFGGSANAGGDAATAVGYKSNAAGGVSVAAGAFANAAGVKSAAIGYHASAKSSESLAFGAYTEAEKHAAAFGPQAKATGEKSVAVGSKAEAQAVGSLALGTQASATQRGGVALGAGSLADRQEGVWGFDASSGEAMNEDTLLGEKKAEREKAIDKFNDLRDELQQLQTQFIESSKKDPIGQDGKRILSDETKQIQEKLEKKTEECDAQFKLVNGYVNAWQSIDGAVSVGNADWGVTRQITGVAAGTEDTDAVNVAQIKAVTKQMEAQATHYFSVNSNDSAEPADTNWNNDGATGVAAVAVGPRTGAQGDYGTAVGSYAQAGGAQSSAFGTAANASGVAATAAGTNAVAGGMSAAAFGAAANASGGVSVATGAYANAAGVASSALGFRVQAKSNESVAVGAFAEAEKHAAALGPRAKALSEQSVAVGGKAEAQAAYSLAIGAQASATQEGGVALGANSLADRQAGVWGFDASTGQAMNEDTLLGEKKAEYQKEVEKLEKLYDEEDSLNNDLKASLDNDPVDNNGKKIESDKTKNLRQNLEEKRKETDAQSKLVNGYVNAWQSIGGAVSVGNAEVGITRQITGVAAGTEDTDAVNVAQLKSVQTEAAKHTTVVAGTNVTVDEGTNDKGGKEYTVKLNDTLTGLKSVETEKITVNDKVTIDKDGLKTGDVTIKEDGIHAGNKVITGVADGVNPTDAVNMRQFGVLENKVETNTRNISLLNGRVDVLDTRVDRVGAGAAALAGLHPLDYDPENKWDFAAGYGNYNGANAIAIGAFYRPDENKMISISGSFGGGENMVSAGISVKLGQGVGISTSKAAMANEIRELKARDREREAQMQEIMRQLEILQKQAGK